MQGVLVVVAALVSALPAFFFAYVALRKRDDDSYEDRLENQLADLRAENKRLAEKLSEQQDENLRLMKKLLSNGH